MNKNLLIFAILGAVILILMISTAIFVQNSRALDARLKQSELLLKKSQVEIGQLQVDKDKVVKQNEHLQADSMSFIELNNRLQKEKEDLTALLEKTQKKIDLKEGDLQRLNKQLEEARKLGDKDAVAQKEKITQERDRLEGELKALKDNIAKERAVYQYNLGVAYTNAGLTDEAIDAYKKSLQFDADNADTHYNVALLCQESKENEKAIEHYRKYIELEPEAEDVEEVEAIILRLKQ